MSGGGGSTVIEEVVGGEIEQVMIVGGRRFHGIGNFLLDGDEVAGGEKGRLRADAQQEARGVVGNGSRNQSILRRFFRV